jgi:transcriptional regulator with XRE-family HTH domain
MLGLTQPQLAELIGVTYQQAHKYEKGVNRVAAGRLYNIARVLGVELNYFFEVTCTLDVPHS